AARRHEHIQAVRGPHAAHRVTVRRLRHDFPLHPLGPVPPAMQQRAVAAEREHVDPVRVRSGRGRLAGETAAEGLPLVPPRAVPVPITKLAVLVDGEDLDLFGPPRRDGGAGSDGAAECDPLRYLIRPCFLSQALATSFGSVLSTPTCLFIVVSSTVVSFGAIELMSFLKSSPPLLSRSLRTTGAMLSDSCKCLSSSSNTKFLTAMIASEVKSTPTSTCPPSTAATVIGPPESRSLKALKVMP